MRRLLTAVTCLMTGWILPTGVSSVTGYRGRPVTINCAYKEDVKTKDQYFSEKSYWSESSKFEIKPMKERTWEHRGRFSVYSDPTRNSLKVTIRDLTDGDKETKYRCSVDVPNGFDDHDYLNLSVLNGEGFDTNVSRDGYLGSSLTIQCKYPQNEEHNVRSFCKEDENLACISLISARPGSITETNRFALSDDKEHQVYTVTITDMTKDDAGKYWCAMQRTEDDSIAYLTQVEVRFLTLTPTSPTVLISDSSAATKSLGENESKQTLESLLPTAPVTPTVHQSNRDIYVAVSLSLTFFLILITLLIIYLRKISKTSGTHPSSVQAAHAGHNTEDNNVAHDYDVVGERRLQEDSGNAPPSIYATANLPSGPSDQLLYSTISFHKEPGCADEASVSMSAEVLQSRSPNNSEITRPSHVRANCAF